MICPNCKAEVSETSAFCENCGTRLAHETGSTTQPYVSPATQEFGSPAAAPLEQGYAGQSFEQGTTQQFSQPYGQAYGQSGGQPAGQPYAAPVNPAHAQYGQPQPQGSNAPFVLAIIALVTALLALSPVSIILAIIALVMNSSQKRKGIPSTHRTSTFVLGLISLIVSIITIILVIALGVWGFRLAQEQGYTFQQDSSGNVTLVAPSSQSAAAPSAAPSASSAAGIAGNLTDQSSNASNQGSDAPASANNPGDAANTFIGVWEIDSMVSGGESVSIDMIETMKEMGLNITLTFNEDGTLVLDTMDEMLNGTWSAASANSVTLNIDNEMVICTLSNGILTLTEGEDSILFHKMP